MERLDVENVEQYESEEEFIKRKNQFLRRRE